MRCGLVTLTAVCGCAQTERAPRLQRQALHHASDCYGDFIAGAGLTGALSAAVFDRGYGNWCGEARSGVERPPRKPADCWDHACRTHDYAFGRVEDGYASCHSVTRPRDLPDTPCTTTADGVLCAAWRVCRDQQADARETWESPEGGDDVQYDPRCKDSAGEPSYCAWLRVYTCGPCPCGSEPKDRDAHCPMDDFDPPPDNCGIAAGSTDPETVASFARGGQALAECCEHYPRQERPCGCRGDHNDGYCLEVTDLTVDGASHASGQVAELASGTSFEVAFQVFQERDFEFGASLHFSLSAQADGDRGRFYNRNCGGAFAAVGQTGLESCAGNEVYRIRCSVGDAPAYRVECEGGIAGASLSSLFPDVETLAGRYRMYVVLKVCTYYPLEDVALTSWCSSEAIPAIVELL